MENNFIGPLMCNVSIFVCYRFSFAWIFAENTEMDAAAAKRVHIEKAHNFMRQFRDPESRELKKLSANQFMEVWSHYDKDGKG